MKSLTLIILFAASGAFALSSLNDASEVLKKTDSSVVILGADHANPGLAKGITDLLASLQNQSNVNCLFLELPSDIQNKLSQAIEENSLKQFSRAFLDSKINATTAAYIQLGAPSEISDKIREAFAAHYDDEMVDNSVSSQLINFLQIHHIHALAFDASSESEEFREATYYSIQDQISGRTLERDIKSMKVSNRRSQIMSQNIKETFKAHSCERALVVVGYAHLFSNDYFKKTYSTDISLKPLQIFLNEMGLKTTVLLSEKAETLINTSLDPGNDADDRFPFYFGKLLNP